MEHAAVYVRVSTNGQDTKSEEPDLKRRAAAQNAPVKWYSDQATETNMNRPGWARLEGAVGRVRSRPWSYGESTACAVSLRA